ASRARSSSGATAPSASDRPFSRPWWCGRSCFCSASRPPSRSRRAGCWRRPSRCRAWPWGPPSPAGSSSWPGGRRRGLRAGSRRSPAPPPAEPRGRPFSRFFPGSCGAFLRFADWRRRNRLGARFLHDPGAKALAAAMSLRALHLARVADSLKTLAGFLEAGIEPVVVNTDPSIRYEFVPALEARIPVASNLYHEVKIPSPRLARYASLLPEIPLPWRRALVRRLAEVLDGSGPVDFVFAHWGATVIPEIRLLLAAGRRAPPVILNMETFPTAWRRG